MFEVYKTKIRLTSLSEINKLNSFVIVVYKIEARAILLLMALIFSLMANIRAIYTKRFGAIYKKYLVFVWYSRITLY